MAIPPAALDRAIPSVQIDIDSFLSYPIKAAGRLVSTAIDPNASMTEQTAASIGIRLLCVAQAIVSFVALPFKAIFALFQGLYTLYSENFAENTLSSFYALASVATHAVAVPTTLILAFMPSKIIENAATLTREGLQLAQQNFGNRNVGDLLGQIRVVP